MIRGESSRTPHAANHQLTEFHKIISHLIKDFIIWIIIAVFIVVPIRMRKNFRLAFRNILRYIGLNAINITGLAIGMIAVLLIFQYITFEKSYDKYFKNADRLQRLVFYRFYQTGLDKSVGNNYFIGQIAHDKLPDIENFCRCKREPQFIQTGDQIFKEERTLFADSSYFDMFSHTYNIR